MIVGVPKDQEELLRWAETASQILSYQPDNVSARVVTTDATPASILTVPVDAGVVILFMWEVVARQSAGSSGTVGDGLVHLGQTAFHLVGSTATIIGSTNTDLVAEDDANWDVAVAGSGFLAEWTVTGAANKTIGWRINVASRRITN